MLKMSLYRCSFNRCQRFSRVPSGSLMMEMSDICVFPERWAFLTNCQKRMRIHYCVSPATDALAIAGSSRQKCARLLVSQSRRENRSSEQADDGCALLSSAREPGHKNRGPCHIRLVFWILSPALLCTVFQQANAADFNQ